MNTTELMTNPEVWDSIKLLMRIVEKKGCKLEFFDRTKNGGDLGFNILEK